MQCHAVFFQMFILHEVVSSGHGQQMNSKLSTKVLLVLEAKRSNGKCPCFTITFTDCFTANTANIFIFFPYQNGSCHEFLNNRQKSLQAHCKHYNEFIRI